MVWMLHILLYDVFLVAAREGLEGGGGGRRRGVVGEETKQKYEVVSLSETC